MEKNLSLKRGQIIWVDFQTNAGSVQGGLRPAVVVQNNIGNKHSPNTIVIPITSSQTKANMPTHVFIPASENILPKDSIVLCEQFFTISKKQIIKTSGILSNNLQNKIDNAILISMGLVSVCSTK